METTNERACTPKEIAIRLSVAPRMATYYLANGIIPGGYKVAGQWRLDAKDLETYIERQKEKVPKAS